MTLTENLLNYLPKKLSELGYPTQYIKSSSTISGGDINEAFRLTTNDKDFFLKINRELPLHDFFEKEARGLQLLRETKSFRIPKFIGEGEFEGQIFLILEMIGSQNKKPEDWAQLFAEGLVNLHHHEGPHFGLDHDNYIGSLPQENTPGDDWTEFFITRRLEPQLTRAGDHFSREDRRNFDRLFHRLDGLIPAEKPALLHGDLWSGNYMLDESGQPVLVDPAVYYGHREMDIAMMHLFGGFDMEIFHLYQQSFPMEEDWQDRIDLHNLYPLLVHVNLFGGHYPTEVRRSLQKYL